MDNATKIEWVSLFLVEYKSFKVFFYNIYKIVFYI